MKQFMLSSCLIALLSACMLTGCGDDELESIEFDTVSTEKVVKLSNEEGTPQCSVMLSMAFATERNGEKAKTVNDAIEDRLLDMTDIPMKHAVDSFANRYTRDYVNNFKPLYYEDRTDTTKHAWYEYHYVITTETQRGHSGISVYIATLDYFEGGAHGINQRLVMNFDDKTGKIVTLADVFVPGYQNKLCKELLSALKEKTDSKNLGELHDKGYLYSMDIFAPENYILGDDTITFIYNPYEIASYDKGAIELIIPYSDLLEIMNKEWTAS